MKNFLFAKFFQQFSAEQLMETCASLGIDGPTLLVRDGYWVTPENIRTALPSFVQLAKEHGLAVEYADTPYNMYELDKLDAELDLLAQNGVKMFRVNYVPKSVVPARELADVLKRYAAAAAAAAERHSLRAIVQLHGSFYPHNATAAWPMVRDLDPRYIGIKMDPGNNLAQEGYELFDYQVELLGEYLAAIGEKDAGLFRINIRLQLGHSITGSCKLRNAHGLVRFFVQIHEIGSVDGNDHRNIIIILHVLRQGEHDGGIQIFLVVHYRNIFKLLNIGSIEAGGLYWGHQEGAKRQY